MTKASRGLLLIFGLLVCASVASIAHAVPATPEYKKWAAGACQHITKVYSTCGAKISSKNGVFRFSTELGQRNVPCSDGHQRPFYDRLDSMDIASILMLKYQSGQIPLPEVRRNQDPGRLRSEDLSATVFGGSEEQVRANLVKVEFLNQIVLFQKHLGAAAALYRVGQKLMAEAAKDAAIAKFLKPFTEGTIDLRDYTIAWRYVKGTKRLSTHSFGTGIDLDTGVGPMYWLWDAAAEDPEKAKLGEVAFKDDHYIPKGKPLFPKKVVDIFEANGFIWGGKWNHYDTMHFEYRPEFYSNTKITCPN